MSKGPVISIVVPSFNQGRYIGETLSSLVDQNYSNLELIVIDGGSTDETVNVIRSFEKHIKFWVSEKDNGQTHAINKGLQSVTGELFNWINSDDVLEPGALQHLADLMSQHSSKNLFIGKTRFFDASGTRRNSDSIVFTKPEITLGYGLVNQPGMFYRTETLRKLLPLNESLHFCMDLDLWMRYLIANGQDNLLETDFCLAGFRFHEASKTESAKNPFRKERDQLYVEMYHTNGSDVVRKSKPYYHLWKSDELMLEGRAEESAHELENVKLRELSFSAMRRYVGLARRHKFGKSA
jgi:glycosyltransferase involved in cell wall biosynthesis